VIIFVVLFWQTTYQEHPIMRMARTLLIVLSITLLGAGAGAASAQSYVATLEGAQEVPPQATPATGSATLTLDGAKMLSFSISYSGLVGIETAAHIHGPAGVGVNAGVVFPLPLGNLKISMVGPLTPAQEADLNAGLYYINVHTDLFPGGEIRGQILAGGVPVEPSTWGRIKRQY
jgi:hypothetical protein